MTKNIELVGYSGPKPFAIILWYKQGEDEPSSKTICYDENDVITAYKRYTTPGDLYNSLRPSIIKTETAVFA